MIEIGRGRRSSLVTHRLASTFGSMAAILLVIWLARGLLSLSQYSAQILELSFGLVFLGLLLGTRTRLGPLRAVASFLARIAGSCVIVIVLIWFFEWVDAVPAVVSGQVTNLVIAAIAFGLLAFAFEALAPAKRGVYPTGQAMMVPAGSEVATGKTTVTVKTDSIALPIARRGRTVGAILYGDIRASFDTPMGPVTVPFAGPMTTFGMPFKGQKADKDDVKRLAGDNLDQLIEKARVEQAVTRGDGHRATIDLPFIHIDEDWFGESVEFGPLRVRSGPDGESVRIGAFELSSEEDKHGYHHRRANWLAKGVQDASYMRVSDDGTSARWNGSSLWMSGDSMDLATGSDGFRYTPAEVKTFSPLHTLNVGREKMTLDTRKFTLNVTDDLVVFRPENGSKRSMDSPELAKDLRNVFSEEAKKHIQDVIKGLPIDLDEMLSSTEEVLAKYG